MRRTSFGTSLVLGAVFVAFPARAFAQPETGSALGERAASDSSQPLVYGVADYRWRLRDLSGRAITLEKFRGRVIFLNLWASWCAPCVAEMASIQALHDSLAAEDSIAFVLVSPEDSARVARFLKRRGLKIPAYREREPLPDAFGLRALPTTFVIDRRGAVVLRHRGAANWDTPAVRDLLRELAR